MPHLIDESVQCEGKVKTDQKLGADIDAELAASAVPNVLATAAVPETKQDEAAAPSEGTQTPQQPLPLLVGALESEMHRQKEHLEQKYAQAVAGEKVLAEEEENSEDTFPPDDLLKLEHILEHAQMLMQKKQMNRPVAKNLYRQIKTVVGTVPKRKKD